MRIFIHTLADRLEKSWVNSIHQSELLWKLFFIKAVKKFIHSKQDLQLSHPREFWLWAVVKWQPYVNKSCHQTQKYYLSSLQACAKAARLQKWSRNWSSCKNIFLNPVTLVSMLSFLVQSPTKVPIEGKGKKSRPISEVFWAGWTGSNCLWNHSLAV